LLGSQVDLLNQRFGELSNALQDPIASFDVFIQKATLASKAQESLALALQETGQTTAAAELIRKEAARTIDPISAQSAVIAQDEFNRVLSDTQDVLGSIVSGPATGFLEFLTTTLRLVAGTPQESKIDPVTNAVKGAETASRKLGRNIGGILAGLGLAAGGIATTFATSGAGAGIGVPLIASGLSIAGIGAAGASAAEGDTRVATSQAVITAELAVTAAKERQVALEREILQARASGKKGLDEQVSLRAQFNALQVEELQGLSRIQQELARKKDGFNDLEDQATAIRQEKELRAAIELRRQALLAAASAAQTASVTDLKNAKQLVGKYGAEREILSTQLEIKSAVDAAYQAQLQLNKARKEGASTAEIEAAEKIVNTLINKRILTELEGAEKIRKIRKDITAEIQLQTAQFQIKSQAIERQIQNVTALGRVEQGAARDALLLRQQVTNEINAARDAESKIASSIQAARTRGGGELTQELRDLYKEQGIAGQQTELALKRGGLSLRDAASTLRKLGEKLYEDLSRAQVSLTEVRSDPAGLNKFLNRGQQIERARQDRTTLQPIFELAQRRFESFTGAEAPEFTGSLEGVNASMRDFINVVNREFDANQRVSDIQKALAENTAALSSINEKLNTTNEELTTQIVALTQKDWNVYLAANYSGNTLQELMKAATLP
jgi:hypothetical protein